MSQFPQNVVISTNKIQPQQLINKQQQISSQSFTTRVINNNVGFSKDLYRQVLGYNNNELDCYNPQTRLNTVSSKSSYNSKHFALPQEKLLSFTRLSQNVQTNQTNNAPYQQQDTDQRLATQIITPQNAISQTHSLVNTARSSNINIVIKKDINKHLANICTDNFLSAREAALEQRCNQNQKQQQQLQNSIKPILAQKNIQNELNTNPQQILKVNVNSNFLHQHQLDQKTFQSKENFQQKAYQKEYTDYKNTSKQNSALLNGQSNLGNLEINKNSQINNRFIKIGELEKNNTIHQIGEDKLTQRRSSIYFQGQDQIIQEVAQNNIYRQNDVLIEQQFQQSQSQQEQTNSFSQITNNIKNNQIIHDKNTIQQQQQQQQSYKQYQQVNCFLNNPYSVYSQKSQFESIQSYRLQEDTQKLVEQTQSSINQNIHKISINNAFQSQNNKELEATISQQTYDNFQQNQFKALPKNQQQYQHFEINSQNSQTAGNQQFNSRKMSYKHDIGVDDFQLRRIQDITPQNGIQEQVQYQSSQEIGTQQPYLYLVPQKVSRQRNKTAINHADQNIRNVKTSTNNLSVYMQTVYTNRSHDIATNNNQLENSYLNEITPASTRSIQQSQLLTQQNSQFQQRNYSQNEQYLTQIDQISNYNSYSHRQSRITRQNPDFNAAEVSDNNNYYGYQENSHKQYSNIYNFPTNQSISQNEFQKIQQEKMTNNMDSSFSRQNNQLKVDTNVIIQQQQDFSSYRLQDQKANNQSFYQDQRQNNNYEQIQSQIDNNTFQNDLNSLKKMDTQNYDQISKSIDEILKNFNFKISNQLSLTNNYQTNAQEQQFQQTESQVPIKKDSFQLFSEFNQQQLNQNNYKTNTSSQRQSFLNGQNNSFNIYLGQEKITPKDQGQIDYNSQNYSQIPSVQLVGNKIIDDYKLDTPFSNRFLGIRKSSRSLYTQNQEKQIDFVKQSEEEKEFQVQNKVNQQNQQLSKEINQQNIEKEDQIQIETQQSDYNSVNNIVNNEHQIPNQTKQTKLNIKTFQQTNTQTINTYPVDQHFQDSFKENKNIDSRLEYQGNNSIFNLKPQNFQTNNGLIKKRSCKSFLQPSNLEKQNLQDEMLNCIQQNQKEQSMFLLENQTDEKKTEQDNKVNTFSKKRGLNTQIIKNLLVNVVESKSLSNSFRQNNLSKNSNSSANYDGRGSSLLGQANNSQLCQPVNQNYIKNSFILKNKLPLQEKSQKNNQSLNLKQKITINEKNNSLNNLNQNQNFSQKLNTNDDYNSEFNIQNKNENYEENKNLNNLTNNNKSCDIKFQQQKNNIELFKNQELGNLESHFTDPGKGTFDNNFVSDPKSINKEIIPQNLLNFVKDFKEEIPKVIKYRNSKSEVEISQQIPQINQNNQMQKQQLILNTLINNKPFNVNQTQQQLTVNVKNQNQQTSNTEINHEQTKKPFQNGSLSKNNNKRKLSSNQSQNFQNNNNQSSNESFKNLKSNNSLTQTINLLLNNFNERQSLEKKENQKLKSARNSLELSFKASQDQTKRNTENIQAVQAVNKSLKGSFINSLNSLSSTARIEQTYNQQITQQMISQNQAEKNLQNQKKMLAEQQLRLSLIEGEMQKQQIQIISYEPTKQTKQQSINSQRSQSEYEYRQNIPSDIQKQGISGITDIIQLNENQSVFKQDLNVMTFCNKDQNFFMNETNYLENDENLPPHSLNQNGQMFSNAFNNESINNQDKSKQSLKVQNSKLNNQIISQSKENQEKENQNLINLNENNSQKLHIVSVSLVNRNLSTDIFKESISPFSQPYSSTSNTSPSASSISLFNLHSVSQNNQQVQVSFRQLPPTLTIEEQIQMFDIEEKLKKPELQLQTVEDISNLIEAETTYYIDYNIFSKSNQFNHQSRFILVDWMQRQCMKFYLKRETTHKAIYYFDLYFTKIQNIKEDRYYIIAIACIFIASKQEEIYPPSLNDILSGSQYASQKNLISQQEIEIIKCLKWKLNPITACYWMDLAMAQWDSIQQVQSKSCIFFRKRDEQSYKRYREAYQFLDFIILDSNKMKYSLRLITITSIYLVICKYYAINPEQPNNQIDQIFQQQSYLQMFQLNINLIKQCSKELNSFFTSLAYDFDYPNAIKQNNFNQKSYEEFLSFQSYSQLNKQNLESLLKQNQKFNL
ncbi:amine-terminal domain cyclin (macronuclear) [Tetrahymena thermophila SB210]|uniref:Amine-terminal domain cyclin n=1 Tax=Tetrahymena thermophila (strain SB210) TaxID=312017 RepID=Q23EC2_TETTS|nr:amine-terminal domain cyclin [Tetrahymena thermophila SB210]EAR94831.2 amine-terminal domain cyclin [Tetrahymena thermophila SB210]|eukprot:XP_001015076.2 amine-terminal domain cyclin [Tetrahymena thermophila SB210]